MKDTELKQMRDRELFDVYSRSLREQSFSTFAQAIDYCRKHTASRYYISPEAATVLVGMITNKVSLINLQDLGRKRAWALYDRYRECRHDAENEGLGRARVLEKIVLEQAPEFYLSFRSTRRAIEQQRRNRLTGRW